MTYSLNLDLEGGQQSHWGCGYIPFGSLENGAAFLPHRGSIGREALAEAVEVCTCEVEDKLKRTLIGWECGMKLFIRTQKGIGRILFPVPESVISWLHEMRYRASSHILQYCQLNRSKLEPHLNRGKIQIERMHI
jgi:hypothetical protein